MKKNIPKNFVENINRIKSGTYVYQHPQFEEPSRKLSLTINVKVQLNDNKIAKDLICFQNEIISSLNYSGANLSGIYRYPIDTLHFSIINFEKYFSKELSESDYYKKYKDKIQKLFEKQNYYFSDLMSLNNKDKKVSIGYIYPDSSSSIAFQVIPTGNFAQALENSCKKIDREFRDGNCIVKSHREPDRFPLNIIRFFRKISFREYKELAKVIDGKNGQDYGYVGDLDIADISVVVSDSWLSNSRERDKNISIVIKNINKKQCRTKYK